MNSCDRRRSRSFIESEFIRHDSEVVFEFEDGFTEEDELWHTKKESQEDVAARARAVLDRVFEGDVAQCVLSVFFLHFHRWPHKCLRIQLFL